MNYKRIIAAVLCSALVAGTAGCTKTGKPSAEDSIESILEDYEEALQDFDADGVLELTKWDDDNRNYGEIEELLDIGNCSKEVQDCYRTIASTITVDYDIDDVKVNDSKASLSVKYELTGWSSVFHGDDYESFEEVNKALKTARSKDKINGKLSFQLIDGEWKISKISALNNVFAFTFDMPDVRTAPDPTEETTATSSETSSTMPRTDDNSEFVEAGIRCLKENSTGILGVESSFKIGACGVYDIDSNGFPELFFLSADQATDDGMAFNGNLTVCSYDPFAKEFKEKIVVRNTIYQAADGGLYIIAATDKELIISHRGGEESQYHITTEIYDFNWHNIANYTRMIYYDYDTEEYTYEYFQNGSFALTEKEYYSVITDYIGRTEVVLDRNYTPMVNDIEFSLAGIPVVGMMEYDQAMEYVKSLRYSV